ncbi:MAG TPA: sulfatase-like hydrolase/transferase [Candidatus Hydrogenedentes bacterium]|nr:sulfatase-like hydrolase/transferase [Candidatus Hydrogenedentota bacterium]
MKKIIGTLIKLGVTTGLFVLLFRPETFGLAADTFGGVKPQDILREIGAADPSTVVFWLLLGVVIKLSGMMCGVVRWKLLLRGQGLYMPFWYMTQSWFAGRSIGIFLPSTLGLDGYRFYDSARYTGEIIKSATVIAVEKLIGFIVLATLVFITLPLGMRLPHLKFNLPVLIVLLTILGSVIVVLFLLLLNPRVIQVLVGIVPTPGFIRNKLNKLGAAATAYSNNRKELLLAVFFGLMVHVATSLTFFCTMMAIRASNTSFSDILFAAPLMITATVFGPSIGGEGIREIVFVTLLGASSGVAAAATFSHLGWWVGDVVPFLLGLPVLVWRKRPSREQMEAELSAARGTAAEVDETLLHLPAPMVAEYRRKVLACLLAGLFGGLMAGSVIGLCESAWLLRIVSGFTEAGAFMWGAVAYGVIFAGVGFGIACGLLFLFLLLDRFAAWTVNFTLSFAGALSLGGLVIGIWRMKRDILAGHGGDLAAYGQVAVYILGAVLISAIVIYLLAEAARIVSRGRSIALLALGILSFAILTGMGYSLSIVAAPKPSATGTTAQAKSSGPNIILVALDALRADFLPLYTASATAKTPVLDALAKESILFENAFAQAPWTKPSFATIFSGLYPEAHTAINKTASLPDTVETLTELLQQGGYYTQGYSNNAFTSSVFNFQQGFSGYVDLKPQLYFGASTSASKLSMYEVLRKVRQRLVSKLSRFIPPLRKMDVRDFYQPAEDVTREALAWMDAGRVPEGMPFYLFLHYMDTHDPFMDWSKPGVGYARSILGDTPSPDLDEPMRAAYISEIEHFDRFLGELIAGLKQRGLYDNSLLVFTADHGEEFLDHKGFWHGFTLYDEMLHIPLMIKLPGKAHAGERNTDLARHIDIAPTLLQAAGLPKGAVMPGSPLVDASGASTNQAIQSAFAHNDFEGNLLHAVRTRESKLILATEAASRPLAPIELYNLKDDPKESKNLADDPSQASLLSALEQTLLHYAQGIEDTSAQPAAAVPLSNEVQEQLKAIGYLQ